MSKILPHHPDWKDSSQYPAPNCKDAKKLAWEFLRRNPHYAEHVAQMLALADGEFKDGVKKKSKSILDGIGCFPPANPGEVASDYFKRMRKDFKGKKARIDKPSNTFVSRWSLDRPVDPSTEYQPSEVRFLPNKVPFKRYADLQTKCVNLFLYPNQIALRFRLDMPWSDQIEAAKTQLKKQIANYGKNRDASGPHKREELAANGTSQLPQVVGEHAHYWLRCYDASKDRKISANNVRLRRLQESGPKQVQTRFNEEKKARSEKDYLVPGKIDGFGKLARDFIIGTKYLMLLSRDNLK